MAFPASHILHLMQLKHITQTCTLIYTVYFRVALNFVKIRYAIKNKVNSRVLVINFSLKAFGCLKLIFAPISNIFFSVLQRR